MNKIIKKSPHQQSTLNRRRFIQSTAAIAGASSLSAAMVERALAAETNFKRVIFWYVPEGCAQQAFWPVNTGNVFINPDANINGKKVDSRGSSIRSYIDAQQATYCLQPLKALESEISLYSGFENFGAGNGDAHKSSVAGALTGGTEAEGSIDQILGKQLQGSSPLSSIYTPVYGHHVHDRGANDGYMSPVRKIGGGTTGSANWNPMDTYKFVFGDEGIPEPNINPDGTVPFNSRHMTSELMKSMELRLEQVKCVGGAAAADKYEALLVSYTKLDVEMQALLKADEEAAKNGGPDVRFDLPNGWLNTAGTRKDSSKYWNQHTNFEKLVDVAMDTTVAALALDRTRVSTLQFSGSGTDIGPANHDHYKTLGLDLEGGDVNDHFMSHDGNDSTRRNQARIFRWYSSKLAQLVQRLKSVSDGAGTLYDSTVIVTCSEFGMRDHRNNDMPYMTLGNAGGAFKMGQYLDARQNGNYRSSADFFYAVAQGLEANLDHFGTSRTPYAAMLKG